MEFESDLLVFCSSFTFEIQQGLVWFICTIHLAYVRYMFQCHQVSLLRPRLTVTLLEDVPFLFGKAFLTVYPVILGKAEAY